MNTTRTELVCYLCGGKTELSAYRPGMAVGCGMCGHQGFLPEDPSGTSVSPEGGRVIVFGGASAIEDSPPPATKSESPTVSSHFLNEATEADSPGVPNDGHDQASAPTLVSPTRSRGRRLRWAVASVALLISAGLCLWWSARPGKADDSTATIPPIKSSAFDRFDQSVKHRPMEVVAKLDGLQGQPVVAISRSGEWIAATSGKSVLLYRVGETEPAVRLPNFPGPVRAVAFDYAGKLLAIGGGYDEGPAGWFQCWSLKASESSVEAGQAVTETLGVKALAFVGNDLLAVGGDPVELVGADDEVEKSHHRMQLFQVTGNTCAHWADLSESTIPVSTVSASRDGRTLAFADEKGNVQVWNFGDEPTPRKRGWTAALLFTVAAGLCWFGRGLLWRLAIGGVVVGLVFCLAEVGAKSWLKGDRYRMHSFAAENPRSLACSADGALLAINVGGKVRLWQRDGSSIQEIDLPFRQDAPVVAIAFSPAGPWLATLDNAGELCVRHLPDGKEVRRIGGLAGPTLALSPEGRHALVGKDQMEIVRLWEADGSDESLRSAEEVLASDLNDADALEQRARIALRRHQYKEARDDLTAAIAQRPSKEAYWLRSAAYSALHHDIAALSDLNEVIARDGKDALAYLNVRRL